MFAIPGICALIVFILARPQEFLEGLQKVPFLYVFSAAAIGGYALDLRLRRLEPVPTPTLLPVVLFLLWAIICTAAKAPDHVLPSVILIAISFVLYGTIAHGVQQFRALQVVTATVMVTCLFLTAVTVHQGFSDYGCILQDPEQPTEGVPDGRGCETVDECYEDAEPGAEFSCEKVGLFGTYAVEDRIRYRGELQDPNELAVTVCIGGLAFLIAFAARRRSLPTAVLAVLGGLLVVECVLLTESRGAVLVVLGVLAVYFVKRYGPGGLIAGAVLGAPLLLLGGRSGANADESTMLRYEAWATGLTLFKSSPLFGVGYNQFTDYHFLTAHNSFVLAVAETGFIGMVLWVSILYTSVKILVVAIRRLENIPGAQVARTWGIGLLASMVGLMIQMNFLSFTYHSVTWIYFGLCSAYGAAVRHHDPGFQVRYGWRDLMFVVGGCLLLVFFLLPLFLRYKGAM